MEGAVIEVGIVALNEGLEVAVRPAVGTALPAAEPEEADESPEEAARVEVEAQGSEGAHEDEVALEGASGESESVEGGGEGEGEGVAEGAALQGQPVPLLAGVAVGCVVDLLEDDAIADGLALAHELEELGRAEVVLGGVALPQGDIGGAGSSRPLRVGLEQGVGDYAVFPFDV